MENPSLINCNLYSVLCIYKPNYFKVKDLSIFIIYINYTYYICIEYNYYLKLKKQLNGSQVLKFIQIEWQIYLFESNNYIIIINDNNLQKENDLTNIN